MTAVLLAGQYCFLIVFLGSLCYDCKYILRFKLQATVLLWYGYIMAENLNENLLKEQNDDFFIIIIILK